ncbi:MAG: hypothetical protein KAH12_05125 [Anaerolineales bacterium]|nr:hypothetical protein [Anaerolineales bacterium]
MKVLPEKVIGEIDVQPGGNNYTGDADNKSAYQQVPVNQIIDTALSGRPSKYSSGYSEDPFLVRQNVVQRERSNTDSQPLVYC